MPLSEHEQRLLKEIEQALYAEDPKFASSVRSARPRNRVRIQISAAVVGILAGIAVITVGLVFGQDRAALGTILGVVGFILIVGSLLLGISALRGPRNATGPVSVDRRAGGNATRPKNPGLRTRMEDRMRRRFEEN